MDLCFDKPLNSYPIHLFSYDFITTLYNPCYSLKFPVQKEE